ncbi:MAG: SDR family NAD(P)-dependent oxidoreductase [Rhodobacteraceae bacterium]|nr:SDR family NAD(P)-dependent oxidoreductase [Paracoccaceae bacterium]
MKIERGCTAYVSGAGSGIGRGIALAAAARGASVAVCDIRAEAAEAVAEEVRGLGAQALAMALDVSDAAAVQAAAARIEEALGPVSLVCNNAGVAMHGVPLHEIELPDWDWVIGVNVMGVVHGIRAFVPRMLARGGPAHVVNTASIGGFQVNPDFLTGAYSMTKYAVVALSEGLEQELSGSGIGVSVLAPAAVATGIHLSGRARPERLGGATERAANHFVGDLIHDGAAPEEIGEQVVRAVEEGSFYIFTHPETRKWIEARHRRIEGGFDAAERMQPPARAAE